MPSHHNNSVHSKQQCIQSTAIVRRNSSDSNDVQTSDQISEEDLRRLRRVAGKVPWPVYVFILFELFESLSFNGTFVVCMCHSILNVPISNSLLQA
jgi:hypothetical protein